MQLPTWVAAALPEPAIPSRSIRERQTSYAHLAPLPFGVLHGGDYASSRYGLVDSCPGCPGWQAFEERLWEHQHPLRQFGHALAPELLFKLEDRGLELDQLQVPFQTCGSCAEGVVVTPGWDISSCRPTAAGIT